MVSSFVWMFLNIQTKDSGHHHRRRGRKLSRSRGRLSRWPPAGPARIIGI